MGWKWKFGFGLIISAAVMLLLPWLADSLIGSDAGMAACLVLFFAVNPIYSLALGAFAGRDVKHLWGLPVISAALFLLGAWMFFDMGEQAFIMYAGIYLLLGLFAMLGLGLIRKKN